MGDPSVGRRLMWHGVLLFLLGLLNGAVISRFANPRMGLSAHLTALMVGTFVLAIGASWRQLALGRRAQKITSVLIVAGAYMNWAALLLAAVVPTRSLTPLAGAPRAAGAVAEMTVTVLLVASAVALVVGCVPLLRGLHRAVPGGRAEVGP